MKIIDLTVENIEPVSLKKIELLYCLQDCLNISKEYFFYPSDYSSQFSRTGEKDVVRLAKNLTKDKLDLIKIGENLFLGHWNDGVV